MRTNCFFRSYLCCITTHTNLKTSLSVILILSTDDASFDHFICGLACVAGLAFCRPLSLPCSIKIPTIWYIIHHAIHYVLWNENQSILLHETLGAWKHKTQKSKKWSAAKKPLGSISWSASTLNRLSNAAICWHIQLHWTKTPVTIIKTLQDILIKSVCMAPFIEQVININISAKYGQLKISGNFCRSLYTFEKKIGEWYSEQLVLIDLRKSPFYETP